MDFRLKIPGPEPSRILAVGNLQATIIWMKRQIWSQGSPSEHILPSWPIQPLVLNCYFPLPSLIRCLPNLPGLPLHLNLHSFNSVCAEQKLLILVKSSITILSFKDCTLVLYWVGQKVLLVFSVK